MQLVNREKFLSVAERRYITFDVTGFGAVRIQSLTEKERSDYEADCMTKRGGVNLVRLARARRKLICLCVVGENNKPMFSPGDIEKLASMDGAYADAIYEKCRTHCGFQENDIEDLVKNCDTVPGDGSQSS